jgi:hypothetical protein
VSAWPETHAVEDGAFRWTAVQRMGLGVFRGIGDAFGIALVRGSATFLWHRARGHAGRDFWARCAGVSTGLHLIKVQVLGCLVNEVLDLDRRLSC